MIFRVEITDVAELEIQEIAIWLLGNAPNYVERWQDGLERSIYSLSQFPTRCPLAPENDAFEAEIRQLLYGVYRILFTIVEADRDNQNDTVHILHVRHGARRRLDE